MSDSSALMNRVIRDCRAVYPSIIRRYLFVTAGFVLGVWLTKPTFSYFLSWFGVGFVTWNVIEYVIHRWAFHVSLPRIPWNHLTFGLHTYHHAHSDELEYVPVPWRFSASVMILVLGGIGLITQSFAALCAAGISLGLSYLYFEWIHRRIHSCKAKNVLEKRIHSFHLHHHHGSQKQNFGLTFPFIDLALGTAHWGKDHAASLEDFTKV